MAFSKMVIEEILNNFDFDKVKTTMTTLNWKWGEGKDIHTPSYNELRQAAKMLLEDSYLLGRCATGGLEAENIDGVLRLIFVAVQAEVEEREE